MKLYIFPAGGNALEAMECLNPKTEIIAFIDDNKNKQGLSLNGVRVLSRDDLPENYNLLAVPGSPENYHNRSAIIQSFKSAKFCNVIAHSAQISDSAQIGTNVFIGHNVVIGPNAVIGDSVIILANSVIHHHAEIGHFSIVGSNTSIAGSTKIGSCCYIASGSSIINNIQIGNNSLVGLGSVVLQSTEQNSRVAGCPAKQLINGASK